MTTLNVDGPVMEAMVAKAILETLTPDKREALIQEAIQHIIATPPKDSRYPSHQPKSPLREAFDRAAERIVNQMVFEQLESDTAFKAQIRKLFDATAEKLMEGDTGQQLATRMAEAFVKGMQLDRY